MSLRNGQFGRILNETLQFEDMLWVRASDLYLTKLPLKFQLCFRLLEPSISDSLSDNNLTNEIFALDWQTL